MKKILPFAFAISMSVVSYAAVSSDQLEDRLDGLKELYTSSTKLETLLKVSTNEDDYPIVTQAPEGTTITYLQDADVYFQIFGDVASTTDIGLTREVVFCEDGTVWFKNFLSGVTSDSYIKGTKEGNKIHIDFPQALKEITNNSTGETSKAYVFRLMHGVDDPLDFSVYPIDEQYIELDISDDNALITWNEPDDFVGMCTFNGGWYGFGAWNYVFRKLDATLVDFPPSGVAREDWTLIWQGIPDVYLFEGIKDVKVAVDDANNEVYIGGLLTTTNDMVTWIKGAINDNQVTFPSGQYLGRNEYDEYVFFMGATYAIEEHPIWNLPSLVAEPLPSLIFDYNGETKTLSIAEEGQMISLNRGTGEIYGDYMPNPIVQMQMADKLAAAPKNPKITNFTDWGDNYGTLSFSLASINVNNMILDTDNIFYNIYLNGEIYTLTKDSYPDLDFNSLTDIPYAYSFWDLTSTMGAVTLYWNIPEEIYSMGVCSYYEDPTTGERYFSDVITYDVQTTGNVDSLTEAKEVISSEWYDLTGNKIIEPNNGIYIKVNTYTDGSRNVLKIIKH